MSVVDEPDVNTPQPVGLAGRRIPWARIAGIALVFLLLALNMFAYYRRAYVGLNDRTASDVSQVARNIAEGRGFSTRWIRPLNLVIERETIDSYVPEINNGPLYPHIAAFFFKHRSPCDQVAIWSSLLFMFAAVVAAFGLGFVLFDLRAGLLAAAILGVGLWVMQVGVSGTPWPMVAVLFTVLLTVVALHHKSAPVGNRRTGMLYAASAGVLVALLYMTDYVLVWLALPLAIYFWTQRRAGKAPLIVFLAVVVVLSAPCAYRNAVHTGFPILGMSAWDLMSDTPAYPGDTLYRSTDPSLRSPMAPLTFPMEHFGSFARKLVTGATEFAGNTPSMLGLLGLAFVFVGMLYRFRNDAANAVRGLLYGAALLMILVLPLYSRSTKSLVMLAPAAAVFAAAYFVLLVDAKKLHPIYSRALIGLFVLATAYPTITAEIWPVDWREALGTNTAARRYLSSVGSVGIRVVFYTDVPWMIAWRTLGTGVWLPLTDADILALGAKDMPMRYVLLTPESDTYPPNEIWYKLHRVKLWRDYIKDPESAVDEVAALYKLNADQERTAERIIRALKRDFAVSETIAGFVPVVMDPRNPDDIQVLISPDLAQKQ